MGVKRGYSSIDEFYVSEFLSLKDLKGEAIVIDTQGLLHRMIRENINNPYEFYLQMINFIEKMAKNQIIPIFVFDGITNLDKTSKSIIMRRKAKAELNQLLVDSENTDSEKIDSENTDSEKPDKITILKKKASNIPMWIINECKHLFNSLDCIYIHINNYEGDQIMAQIIKHNLIKYVYSEDFDMLLFDIPYVLKSLDYINDIFKLYIKKNLLVALDVSSLEIIDIAFLTGTDFNCRLYKSSFKSNLEIIKKYRTIENFKDNLETINLEREEGSKILLPTYNFDFKLVKDYFTLENIDDATITVINSKLDSYFDKKTKNQNDDTNTDIDVINTDNIIRCFEKLKMFKLTDYINYKYTLKLHNYCKLHFGISLVLK